MKKLGLTYTDRISTNGYLLTQDVINELPSPSIRPLQTTLMACLTCITVDATSIQVNHPSRESSRRTLIHCKHSYPNRCVYTHEYGENLPNFISLKTNNYTTN
ncbi:hypothetical protein IX321_002757 [Bacteroides pyogenes]|nr:hypothetical protein [Bacteroides pyogenes]MBR8718823.1 hypothetical protein [Bacteroides pyogenes]MBR8748301.1 hypothetical protein [Bacteroides pyogenes]MBR8758573.1 hypothetical protein [Bacteroides pyogenes]MBR8781802.1 hypothetical protein [Bacteroides pyogenes]